MNGSNKFSKLYPLVENNKKEFDELIRIVNDTNINFDKRLKTAVAALKVATYQSTGYFYSNDLERFFINIAQTNDIEKYSSEFCPKTILHVLTQAYKAGGHTRVAERWVENLTPEYKSSVVLINQEKKEIPPLLIENVQKSNGNFIKLKSQSIIDKGLELRKLAMNYEYIVLHTHMEDPVATIAFGTQKFMRPILFFNHADHLFWIGRTIADVVLELKSNSISRNYRNITDSIKCPIPASKKITSQLNQANILYSSSKDEQIILTSGSAFKYTPICAESIFDTFDRILWACPKAKMIVIGVTPKDKNWQHLIQKYKDRISLLGGLPFAEYQNWISKANVVLDSYPMGGGTALTDAINCGVPFVSLDNVLKQIDPVINSIGFCRTKEEFIEKTLKILAEPDYRQKVLANERACFEKENSPELWLTTVKQILKNTPKVHRLRDYTKTSENFINDYSAILAYMYKGTKISKIFDLFIIKLYKQKTPIAKSYIIEIFGKKYSIKTKKLI